MRTAVSSYTRKQSYSIFKEISSVVSNKSILIVTARINLESAGDTGWTTAAEAGVDAEL